MIGLGLARAVGRHGDDERRPIHALRAVLPGPDRSPSFERDASEARFSRGSFAP
jgi:hypothetical protein